MLTECFFFPFLSPSHYHFFFRPPHENKIAMSDEIHSSDANEFKFIQLSLFSE